MSISELGRTLCEMYEKPGANKVAMIHLFGIKYAEEITSNGYNVKDIIKASGIKESYWSEVNKGIKLSQYVEIKQCFK